MPESTLSNTTVCLIIHLFCESCDPEIVLNSAPNYYAQYSGTRLVLFTVLNSKQKQLHGHKSNKMRKPTLFWIGNFEKKINLSHICYFSRTLNIFQTLQWTLDVHPVIFVWTLPQRNADVFASILVETHRVRVTNEFAELAVILAYKNSHLIKCPNMFKV